jgi:hypothetical protein
MHSGRHAHSAQLDDGRKRFEHDVERHRDQADAAVSRVAGDATMLPEQLGQALRPTAALTRERPRGGWNLGPADGLGHERDPIRLAPLPHHAVDFEHQFGVLAHRVEVQPADRNDDVASEHAKRAGDDQQRAELGPPGATEQERAQVFEHLDALDPTPRHRGVDDPAVDHAGPVGGADDAAGSDHLRVVDERLGHSQERLTLEQRVGIHGNEDGHARRERVRARALLVPLGHRCG